MRHASLFFAFLVLTACGGRDGDRTGTDAGDAGTDSAVSDMSAADAGDAGAADAGDVDAAADAGPADSGPIDIGAPDRPDLGEPCGAVFCGGGTYCCAAACNLCLDSSRICGSMPCAGIDAGPRDSGAGGDSGTGARCGAVTCRPGDVCMDCLTPFGTVPECLPAGSAC